MSEVRQLFKFSGDITEKKQVITGVNIFAIASTVESATTSVMSFATNIKYISKEELGPVMRFTNKENQDEK